jgi:hypothetical protein
VRLNMCQGSHAAGVQLYSRWPQHSHVRLVFLSCARTPEMLDRMMEVKSPLLHRASCSTSS